MKAIVSVDQNWAIGYKGKLLERIPDDMKYFKEATRRKIIIMGKETFLSLPGGEPLKDRVNIVLCEDRHFSDKLIVICTSLEELFTVLEKYPPDQVFVIGGQSVYAQLLPYCNEALVTRIENQYTADTYFPNLDEDENWRLVLAGEPHRYNDIIYSFTTYINNRVKSLQGPE